MEKLDPRSYALRKEKAVATAASLSRDEWSQIVDELEVRYIHYSSLCLKILLTSCIFLMHKHFYIKCFVLNRCGKKKLKELKRR